VFSEKGQPQSGKSGKSGFAKPNHNSSNITILGNLINTEIIVGVTSVYKAESVFSHDGNAVFSIKVRYRSRNKAPNCKYVGGNISVFENS
jgi:hypothetical protein